MDTSRSEQPAKRRRPTRRSMVEFAALLESGAVVEKLTSRQAIINGQTNKAQGAAASVPQNKNLNYSGPEDDRTSQQLDEVTLAAAKSEIRPDAGKRRSTSRPRPIVHTGLPARICLPALPTGRAAERAKGTQAATRSNGSSR